MSDETIGLALDTIQKKKQALVFAPSRMSAEKTAEEISKKTKINLPELSQKILKGISSPTKQCRRLSHCVNKGIAFHHAGLTQKQKELIESEFREGKIKIICSTPTLAAGINTPAFRVIIKNLKRYSGRWGMDWIPVLEYYQMAGRCVGKDTLLFNEKGFPVKIDELAKNYFASNEVGEKVVKKNLLILSLNINTLKPELINIKKVWRRKVKEILEIETRSGKLIRVTPEHPFLCFNKSLCGKIRLGNNLFDNQSRLYKKVISLRKEKKWGENRIAHFLDIFDQRNKIKHWLRGSKPKENTLFWEKAVNLKQGNYKSANYAAGLLNFNQFSEIESPRKYLPWENIIEIKEDIFMNKQGHQKCSFPKEWSIDLCRFIAKIMSDGNIYFNRNDNSYLIRYYNKYQNAQKEYAEICLKLFNKKTKINWRKGSYCSSFKSYVIGKFLENIEVPSGKKSFILKVPRPIFSLPNKYIKEFIKEYVFCDGWVDNKKKCKIYNLVTSSKELAYDFALLLSKIGLIARIYKKGPNSFRENDIWVTSVTASQFDENKKMSKKANIFPDQIKNIKLINEEQFVYDLTLEKNHNFIANGMVIHNSGRPGYEEYGEAIVIAKNDSDKKEIHERYVCGQPEDIYSKLAVEPVFRTYLLSLIASGITNTRKEIVNFFSKTFWAYQFKDMDKIEMMIDQMIDLLEEYEFIRIKGNEEKDSEKTDFISAGELNKKDNVQIRATLIGKRVSELYLDPLTANQLIERMRNTSKVKLTAFSFLQMISHTLELFPPLRIKVREHDEIQEKLVEKYDQLLESEPDVYDVDYGDFMNSIKTALFFESWIDEREEDFLLEKYNIRPGEIYAKLDTADWLLYSSSELARLMQFQPLLKELNKLRIRVKNGVREELLPLLRLKGIGRKRARGLHNNGFKNLGDLKKADTDVLGQLIGKAVAVDVKKQLGEKVEEVSDRKRKGQLSVKKYQ